jgi:sulfite exporter TauE/SafE
MDGLWLSFGTGFSIGMLGSLHCIGMCGPLALALPIHRLNGWARTGGILAYNLGRTLTYASLGALFGIIGRQFTLWGWQQALSITAGILMLLFLFGRYASWSSWPLPGRLQASIGTAIATRLGHAASPPALLAVGLLNGLLPCGLVYVAVLAAIPMGTVARSATLMAAFGLGTIPTMAGLMLTGQLIGPAARRTFNRIVPYFVALVAVLLILRGLNLGIPFVSPMTPSPTHPEMCHDPVH